MTLVIKERLSNQDSKEQCAEGCGPYTYAALDNIVDQIRASRQGGLWKCKNCNSTFFGNEIGL